MDILKTMPLDLEYLICDYIKPIEEFNEVIRELKMIKVCIMYMSHCRTCGDGYMFSILKFHRFFEQEIEKGGER